MTIINFHLDVSFQAEAMLCLLRDRLDDVRNLFNGNSQVLTFHMINGREKGYCIVFTKNPFCNIKQRMFVFFAEDENTDDFFIQMEKVESTNQLFDDYPVFDNFSEKSYKDRKYFLYMNIVEAYDYLRTEVLDWFWNESK